MEGSPIPEAESQQKPKRWPLVQSLDSRNSNFSTDARLVNAYAERSKVTGEWQVEKRPGFGPTPVFTGGGPGQGVFTVPYFNSGFSAPNAGYVYQTIAIANNTAWSLYTNSSGINPPVFELENLGVVNISAYPGPLKAQFIAITIGAGAPPLILFGGGATVEGGPPSSTSPVAYYMTAGTPVLSTLVPGTNYFPYLTVPGFVFLDGYTYVMDISGTIWETATQNQVAEWSALAFIGVQSDADLAVQLARQLIYVVAIKQWTTTFLYDAGNTTGSSLSPVPGAVYNFGCLSSDTFADLDGVLFWATQSKNGTHRIVQVENLNASFVSTPAVERQLDLGPGSQWYSMAYHHAGHRWYVITNITTNVTMVYDITEKLWYLWTDYAGNYFPVVSRCVSPSGQEWHQLGSNGNIYVQDADYVYPNDYGNIVPVDIYTPNFDAGVDRIKYLSQMRFNADQTNGSTLYMRSSDNDYGSFNNFRKVDLSRKRPIINDEGSFYRRAYHFRHYANTPFRIRSVDLQMDIGTL